MEKLFRDCTKLHGDDEKLCVGRNIELTGFCTSPGCVTRIYGDAEFPKTPPVTFRGFITSFNGDMKLTEDKTSLLKLLIKPRKQLAK